MYIKILCSCGSKYGFDVEPIAGRMPSQVRCPACGADGTDQANEIARQQSAPAQLAAPTPVAAAPAAGIRLSGHSTPAPAPSSAGPVPTEDSSVRCHRHTKELAADECRVCGKPICGICMSQTGFVCSVFCKEQARQRNIDVPIYKGQLSARGGDEAKKVNLFLRATVAAIVLIVAVWAYYTFYASRPKLALLVGTTQSDPFVRAVWAGPDIFVALANRRMSAHDVNSGKELWRISLGADEKVVERRSLFDERPEPQLRFVKNRLWLAFPSRISQIDLLTGKRLTEVALPQPILELSMGDEEIIAVAEENNQRSLIKVDLNTGQKVSQPLPAPFRGPRSESSSELVYVPAHGSALHLETRLLEARIVMREAIKPQGPSKLENSNLRASDSTEAARQMLNDMQREKTGGVEREDESRYQATLTRYFAGGPEWTGEVIGPPQIFSLTTVDAVVAGKTLYVFNKATQKIWEAKLTYTISPRYRQGDISEEKGPLREIGGRLLIFDQGMLSAFDIRSGAVQWRVTTVGISDIVPDQGNNLYVCATTAGPEAIKYNQDITVTEKIQPLLLKVERSSGRVLWQQPRIGEHVYVSGKYVYAARGQISRVDQFTAATSGGDYEAPTHYRVWRLDPGNGRELWEYYRPKTPLEIIPSRNRILLQYRDEVRLLGFSSL